VIFPGVQGRVQPPAAFPMAAPHFRTVSADGIDWPGLQSLRLDSGDTTFEKRLSDTQ